MLAAPVWRCGDCLRAAPAFDATVAATDYAPPLDQLVLALKFGGRLELAPLLAALLHEAAEDLAQDEQPALLVPVPLGSRRLTERGFNQALEIAKPLGRALGLPVAGTLVRRVRDTDAQSLLHPDERRRNVAGAFSVRADAAAMLRGRHIGLVDDVMTTGETLHALAAALKQAGVARVTNFVFARTLAA
jgi:ComF family protein